MLRRFLSIALACLVLLNIGINGQKSDNREFLRNNMDNNYSYGKLRLNKDGQNEELISVNLGQKTMVSKNENSLSLQPLPTPCAGARPSTKLVHPADKTKYIQCRDEFHYEIVQCPAQGEFDDLTKSCTVEMSMVNPCETEKPCLHDGECLMTSNATFKCTCRSDWTGDRCETPVSSCASQPCGPLGECRPLKIADYQQDYVCVCNGRKEYGPNCQDVVPNPCTYGSDQYYPFAFNSRAYIQCDGEMVHIQPCGPMLFWNQEQRYCDRRRMNTATLKKLTKKTTIATPLELQTEPSNPINTLETTTFFDNVVVLGKINPPTAQGRGMMMDETIKVVPTRVSNRPQVPDMQNQGYASAEFTSSRLRSNQQQLDLQSMETTIKTPTWQTNFQSQNMESLNLQQMQNNQAQLATENEQKVVAQPTQNFGGQRWTSQQGGFDQVNSQRFPAQSWQQNSNQGSFMETSTVGQPIFRSQDLPLRDQEQSRPIFTTNNNQFMAPSEFRTSSLPTFTGNFPETTTVENRLRFTGDLSSQQSWQNRQLNSVRVIPNAQPQRIFSETQRSRMDQQWPTTTVSTLVVSEPEHFGGDGFVREPWSSQQEGLEQTSNQRFPTQTWQQNQNQGSFMETSTVGQPVFRLQDSVRVTSNTQPQRIFSETQRTRMDQQWPTTTLSTIPVVSTENTRTQMIAQPTQNFGGQRWTSQQGGFDQVNSQRFPAQSWQQNSNQGSFMETSTVGQPMLRQRMSQSLNSDASDSIRSNQLTAQQTLGQPSATLNLRWQEQRQPIAEMNNDEDSRTSIGTKDTIRPNTPTFVNAQATSNGNFVDNSPETTTMTDNLVGQRFTVPNFTGWRAMRTNDQRPTLNSAASVQQSVETRPASESIPASWRNRM